MLALFLLATITPLPAALVIGAASPVAAAGEKSPAEDRSFLTEAARDGRVEVELGRMAAQRASSPEVKQFAERMVKDHEAANQQLVAAAREPKKTKEPPADEEAQAKMRELQGLSGAKFDQAYMRTMVEDHVKAVDLFQREAKDGKEAEVRKLAETILPTLQEHLTMARSTAGGGGSMNHNGNTNSGGAGNTNGNGNR
jgi:putative membrane protein